MKKISPFAILRTILNQTMVGDICHPFEAVIQMLQCWCVACRLKQGKIREIREK